jgi:hypothetical protein
VVRDETYRDDPASRAEQDAEVAEALALWNARPEQIAARPERQAPVQSLRRTNRRDRIHSTAADEPPKYRRETLRGKVEGLEIAVPADIKKLRLAVLRVARTKFLNWNAWVKRNEHRARLDPRSLQDQLVEQIEEIRAYFVTGGRLDAHADRVAAARRNEEREEAFAANLDDLHRRLSRVRRWRIRRAKGKREPRPDLGTLEALISALDLDDEKRSTPSA